MVEYLSSTTFPATQNSPINTVLSASIHHTKQRQYWKAAQGFESLFLYMLLKEMRRTVPTSSLLGGGILHTFGDLQLAQQLGRSGQLGIASLFYRHLTQSLEPQGPHPMSSKPIPPLAITKSLMPNSAEDGQGGIAALHHPDRPSPLAQQILTYHERLAPFLSIIYRAAKQFQIDPGLIKAIILAESNGKPNAISPAGAKGLMQLMDGTATDLGITDPFDPEQNIMGGTQYLRLLLDRVHNDVLLAVAAYNAGISTIEQYQGIPPYPETRQYLRRVRQLAIFFGFPFPSLPPSSS